jgi:predicted secreted acid phosphatase
MTKFFRLAAVLGLVALLTTGCAVNRATSSVDPSANLSALKTMYVKKIPNDDETNALIADKLRSKGITVTTGTETPPGNVDAVVTYIDRWMWDITMYMLELTITIRDPKTDFPMATGNSYHTSLTRLSPKEMVNEVVENIYKGANK